MVRTTVGPPSPQSPSNAGDTALAWGVPPTQGVMVILHMSESLNKKVSCIRCLKIYFHSAACLYSSVSKICPQGSGESWLLISIVLHFCIFNQLFIQ